MRERLGLAANRLRIPDLTRIRLRWLRIPSPTMPRASVTFRPTAAQRQWLDCQRRNRGIPVTTLIQLALEAAMAADPSPAQEAHEAA